MIVASDTLGALVTANPARARLLEALDLDYCCHGERTLDAAAAEAGRPIEAVIQALEAVDGTAAPGAPTWATMPLPDLLDHLVATHHAYLRTELPRLLPLARKVAEVHGSRHPELQEIADDVEQLWVELEPHLDEEERSLFPTLAAGGTIDEAAVREDHESVGGLLDRIRALSGTFEVPADGCASYKVLYRDLEELDADTRLHVHKENNLVLQAV